MRQILQNLKSGAVEIVDVPAPKAGRGQLLIRTTRSLVSAGTERMLVDFGKAGLIEKARQQPDKVRMVLDKIRTDGVVSTYEAVRDKLDQPIAMGYCNVGVVEQVGDGVTGFSVGDRVASNGKHAELVAVPVNLCARIPDGVDDEAATFTVLGAIALQGLRLVQPALGETVVVTGLGLIGLVTVQLLRAHGCRVIGIDYDPSKLALARRFGAEVVDLGAGADPVAVANAVTRGRGVDAVLITASTRSNEPVRQAALMCRKRGRIVLVGVAGLELSRADFYEKELSFQVSCSYGPGRYDPEYEEKGHDYPFGLVRWTEQRNFEALLDLMASRSLDVASLVTHRYPFERSPAAYELLSAGRESCLGIVLEFPAEAPPGLRARSVPLRAPARDIAPVAAGRPRLAFIGAGNYGGRVLIPAFAAAGADLRGIATSSGVTAGYFGRKHGFATATTDAGSLLTAADVDGVVISTRHDTHARFVCEALAAGKHVFVEKPLALTRDEVDRIERTWDGSCGAHGRRPLLMVGFNRRFAPHVVRMKQLLDSTRAPKCIVVTVNAGSIPAGHWTQDPLVGGGRLVGEGCHFIDLMRFLVGEPIVDSQVASLGRAAAAEVRDDKVVVTLAFADGSLGTLHYLANGDRSFPKERVEVFCGGRILQLDNFRRLTGYGWPGFRVHRAWRQDKGQRACAGAFLEAMQGKAPAPIPPAEIFEVARITIELGERARC